MEPDKYFDQSPAIIPVQGELHGFFHLMHCHWRLNRPFIMQCADVLGNKQVKSDPSVSDLNVSRFFLINILARAAGEYIVELCRDDPDADDWDDPGPFMAKASANVNFEYLVHFLHDNAFACMEFLDGVRGLISTATNLTCYGESSLPQPIRTQLIKRSMLACQFCACSGARPWFPS